MLAGVSHDLRTPLTRMKLQLAMMPEGDESKVSLESDVADMEKMVEGYLAFARGQEAEAVEETDVTELFQDIVMNARRQGTAASLETPKNLHAELRPSSFKRCITNLNNNPSRYATEIWITVKATNSEMVILIDDDGPGIPEEKRKDVFRPFFRLDPSRNMETGGSGLGMTIARDVIHGHGGQISLGEAPAGGLRIEIRLPL
jgi:two-component system osmolarity sensor histidine kinase EnvZ